MNAPLLEIESVVEIQSMPLRGFDPRGKRRHGELVGRNGAGHSR